MKKRLGKLVRMEKGKSEVKMGDAQTLENLIFDEILKDPEYLVEGLTRAIRRRNRAK